MTWTWLLPMTIILPITGAALTLVAGRRPHVHDAAGVEHDSVTRDPLHDAEVLLD